MGDLRRRREDAGAALSCLCARSLSLEAARVADPRPRVRRYEAIGQASCDRGRNGASLRRGLRAGKQAQWHVWGDAS
jgi:hypothetical protein